MNTNVKPVLWALFFTLLVILWFKWEAANAPPPPVVAAQQTTTNETLPVAAGTAQAVPGQTPPVNNAQNIPGVTPKAVNSGRLIEVKTDVLHVAIDTEGGSIVESQLLKYSESIKDKTPIQLFSSEKGKLFHFQTGLGSKTHKNNAMHQELFKSAKNNYELSGDSLSVPLTWAADGVTVTKTFTFYKGRYNFDVKQSVSNNSDKIWEGYQYAQLKQDEVKITRSLTTFNTFAGAVYSIPETKYKKISFDKVANKEIDFKNVVGGWVGFMRQYFMGAIIPPQDNKDTFFSHRLDDGTYAVGMAGMTKVVPVGTSATFEITGFVGPKIKDELAKVAPNLDKATDYGWFFFISEFLFNVLDWVHSVVKNWGWAIVIVTISIKVLLFPLAAKSFKSMAKMRKFQPEMERIRENYGGDRQLMGQKMMALYKKEGINPASGCLPILVQIPIFLAFYYMLMESVELRQAPWIFWIKDLSLRDPYYVLPVLNTGLMFLQQRLNPPPSDPIQRRVMTFLPVVFGLLFMVFPAGLVLYWAVSNSFSIIQQYVITKRYGGLAHPLSHAEEKH